MSFRSGNLKNPTGHSSTAARMQRVVTIIEASCFLGLQIPTNSRWYSMVFECLFCHKGTKKPGSLSVPGFEYFLY